MQVLDCNKNNLKMAIQALLTNKVVVYPTETAYGLGGNALNKDVVQKIYTIKDRPKEKLLTVIVASFEMAYEFFRLLKIIGQAR